MTLNILQTNINITIDGNVWYFFIVRKTDQNNFLKRDLSTNTSFISVDGTCRFLSPSLPPVGFCHAGALRLACADTTHLKLKSRCGGCSSPFCVLLLCRRDASHDTLTDTTGEIEDWASPFHSHYPFVFFPFLKNQRNAHLPVSLLCCSFLHLVFEIQNKKWLPLLRDIELWLRCKLVWKADAHTSYFTHQNTKLITMTPSELRVANFVSGLSWTGTLVSFFPSRELCVPGVCAITGHHTSSTTFHLRMSFTKYHRRCFLSIMSFAPSPGLVMTGILENSAGVDAPDVGWLKTAFTT